jgi:hypothetical protein
MTLLYLQKLALTSPASDSLVGIVHSWTKVTELLLLLLFIISSNVLQPYMLPIVRDSVALSEDMLSGFLVIHSVVCPWEGLEKILLRN